MAATSVLTLAVRSRIARTLKSPTDGTNEMAEYRLLTDHGNPRRRSQSPNAAAPVVLTAQDGLPVIYGPDSLPTCGFALSTRPIRRHPRNITALPCSTSRRTGNRAAFPRGRGDLFGDLGRGVFCSTTAGNRKIGPGHHIFLPSWAEHGVENTGADVLVVLLSTSPANP